MTGMLASISNLEEAKIVLQENVDIIDLKDPLQGALGAVTTATAREVVAFVSGRCFVSATIGDLPMQATAIKKAIVRMASTGVDIIKVGVFDALTDKVIATLKEQAIKGAKDTNGKQFTIVMVFFVDKDLNLKKIIDLAKVGVRGVMLDTAEKMQGNLRMHMQDKELRAFVKQAKSYGLLAGLAGSLKACDIAPLLKVEPDYLGFRGALCRDNLRTETLNVAAVRKIRFLLSKAQNSRLPM